MRATAQPGLLARLPAVLLAVVLVAACASESATPTAGSEASGLPSSTPMTSSLLSTQTPGGPTGSAPPEPTESALPEPSASGATETPAGTQPPVPSPAPSGSTDPRVDAALASLTTDTELVDQLLFVGWAGTTPNSVRGTLDLLHPGGIVYVGANADRAAEALAINQAIATEAGALGILPPFIAIDHEGGSVQRIDDVPNLGSNMAFGDTNPSDQEACQRGAQQAADLAAMDFNMNLAPVLDVLTNSENTVIGDRSYGSDPDLVARLGADYIDGLQGAGIMAVGKHFPGHGATTVDSHFGLPVLPFGLKRLERVELVPFERALEPDVDVSAIMVAHISLPKIDPSGAPSSLSEPVVTGILRERLGFDGLVMTDDIGAMQAVTGHYSTRQAAVMAITAGVDMLLIVGDQAKEITSRDALLRALADGTLSRDRLMDAVHHVLAAKARFGLLGGDGEPAFTC
jgi:beta-N-acetylhexosaminidase